MYLQSQKCHATIEVDNKSKQGKRKMKLTKEQKEDLQEALEHWNRVCKVADREDEKPMTFQTQIIINDLKEASKYLRDNFNCCAYHPLMDWDGKIVERSK